MRIVVILLLILGEVALLAIRHDAPAAPTASAEYSTEEMWVRTVDGWQPLDSLHSPQPKENRLHPLPVAALVLMSSLLVLISASDSWPTSNSGKRGNDAGRSVGKLVQKQLF